MHVPVHVSHRLGSPVARALPQCPQRFGADTHSIDVNTRCITMFTSSKGLRAFLLCLSSASLLAACGGNDDNIDDRIGLANPKVRFVHAVPGAPAVTLQRQGQEETGATDVGYKHANQYQEVNTEVQNLSLRLAGTNTEVATARVGADRGHKYTVVALPGTNGVELKVIDDPYNKRITTDDARVRVLNAAANAPALDVYVTDRGANLMNVGPRMSAVAFKQPSPESGADSLEISGGAYQLRITEAGTKTVIFNSDITLPSDADWLLVVLPADATPMTPNAVQVLLVRSDDSNDATDELMNQP
jgi:hypothetical protein